MLVDGNNTFSDKIIPDKIQVFLRSLSAKYDTIFPI